MEKTVADFLTTNSDSSSDVTAKRAVALLFALAAAYDQSHQKSDLLAMSSCHMGALTAAYVFAAINADKNYGFADKVHPRIAEMTRLMQPVPFDLRLIDHNLAQAEESFSIVSKRLGLTASAEEICGGQVISLFWNEQRSLGR